MTASVPAAPGRLELVRAFVNTLDIEAGIDALDGADALATWLRSAGLLAADDHARAADVEQTRRLREAMRSALAANHAGDRPPWPAVDVLNDVAQRADLRVTLSADGDWTVRPTASGVAGALGALLAIVMDAMHTGTWPRLKVCANDACQWAFYDHSRARAGKWCSMGVCGNRAKQRAWRQRQS